MSHTDEGEAPNLERQVAERTRELAVLNTIAAVVSQSLDPQQMLEAGLDEVRGLLGVEYGCIYALEGHDQLVMIAQRGQRPSPPAAQPRLRVEGTISGLVAQDAQPLTAEAGERAFAQQAELRHTNIQRYVGVPLRSMRQVVGVLVLLSVRRVSVSQRDLRLLEAIGDHIGVALANARLFEAEQHRRRQAEILRDVATVVASTHSLENVLDRILEHLDHVVPYDSAAVQLLRDGQLEIVAAHGYEADSVRGLRVPLEQDYPGTMVINSGAPLILNQIDPSSALFSRRPFEQLRSWLGVPLTSQGRTIGTLTLGRRIETQYQAEDAALAASFASQAALAIERDQLLEQERRRRHVAEALREGLMALTSTLDLTSVLKAIVAQACRLMDSDHCAIYELSEDRLLRVRSARGLPEEYIGAASIPLGQAAVGRAVQERRPVTILHSAEGEPEPAPEGDGGEAPQSHALEQPFRAHLAVPIIAGDEIYGGIAVYYHDPGELQHEQESLLSMFAGQAALAIKNARLLERERNQRAQLEALNDRIAALSAIGRAAASSLETITTLPDLSSAVQRLISHDLLVLALFDERNQQLTLLAHPPRPVQTCALATLPDSSPLCIAITGGAPVVVSPVEQDAIGLEPLEQRPGSLIAAPLMLHGRTVGALCLGSAAEAAFQPAQSELACEIAEEIATATVNAQLHHRSRELVLVEERTRLARELHDSVTQLVFSISLMAQTAHLRLESRPDQTDRVLSSLSNISELAQNALNEMRSLIFELRPQALEEAGLLTALQRHIALFRGRAGVDIALLVDEALVKQRLPLRLEETLYRITQEALNNIYKHAAAHHIRLSLNRYSDHVALSIEDDGRGFDPQAPQSGHHIGRSTMRERAEAVGGTLTIESEPGSGTSVRAQLPLR